MNLIILYISTLIVTTFTEIQIRNSLLKYLAKEGYTINTKKISLIKKIIREYDLGKNKFIPGYNLYIVNKLNHQLHLDLKILKNKLLAFNCLYEISKTEQEVISDGFIISIKKTIIGIIKNKKHQKENLKQFNKLEETLSESNQIKQQEILNDQTITEQEKQQQLKKLEEQKRILNTMKENLTKQEILPEDKKLKK